MDKLNIQSQDDLQNVFDKMYNQMREVYSDKHKFVLICSDQMFELKDKKGVKVCKTDRLEFNSSMYLILEANFDEANF